MNENKVCSSEGNIEGFLYRKNLFLYPAGAESCRFCLTLQTMKGEDEKRRERKKRKRRGRKKGRKKMRKRRGRREGKGGGKVKRKGKREKEEGKEKGEKGGGGKKEGRR